MKRKLFDYFALCILIIFTVFIFRKYFFQNKVPLPFNLLVSYYSPWKFEQTYGITVPNKPLGYDNIKLFYPLRKFTVDEMKQRRIPLWNPFVFSGNVHLATYQSSVLYPLDILYLFFPIKDAWTLLILFQPILSGFFTYLFLRSLKLSFSTSVFGSLSFAFSGWMIAMWEEVLVLEHSFLWLPLALYSSNVFWEQKIKFRAAFLLILSLAMSVLAGFLQMSMYLFLTVLIYNFFLWFTKKGNEFRDRNFFIILICFFMSMLLSAIQWIPALEAYVLSARGTSDAANLFDMFLSPLSHMITVIVPDFWGNPGSYNYFSSLRYIQERTIYVNLFAVIFSLFIVFTKTKGMVRFWKYFTLIVFSLGFALPTSWIWYALRIPILSVAQPARIFALSTFSICVLASFGLDEWMKSSQKNIIKRIIAFLLFIIFVLFVFTLSMRFLPNNLQLLLCGCKQKQIASYITTSLRNLMLPGIFLVFAWMSFVFFRSKRRYFLIAVYTLTIFGSLYYANKMLYFSDKAYEFPSVAPIEKLKEVSGLNRVWSYGEGHVMRNILSYYGIYSPEGYDALFSRRYGELVSTISFNGKPADKINRTDVDFSEVGPGEAITKNPFRLRIMSLLGVRYILALKNVNTVSSAGQEIFPKSQFSVVWENEQWQIWENTQALPRAFLVSQVIVQSDPQKIIDTLLDPATDLKTTIILEDSSIPGISQIDSGNRSETTIISYQPSSIEISVRATSDEFLFLSDTYYPGWKAFVDGVETKIYRANYTFRAVPVSAGNHTVKFVYDPLSFKIGLGMTLAGIVLLIVVIILYLRRSNDTMKRLKDI